GDGLGQFRGQVAAQVPSTHVGGGGLQAALHGLGAAVEGGRRERRGQRGGLLGRQQAGAGGEGAGEEALPLQQKRRELLAAAPLQSRQNRGECQDIPAGEGVHQRRRLLGEGFVF